MKKRHLFWYSIATIILAILTFVFFSAMGNVDYNVIAFVLFTITLSLMGVVLSKIEELVKAMFIESEEKQES